MLAGFAQALITPPPGTAMAGWSQRDIAQGCQAVRDDLYARALWLEHEGEAALLVAYDLLFLGRHNADRFKGALGRVLDLAPRRILLHATHNHAGPGDGGYGFGVYEPQDLLWLEALEAATLSAAQAARAGARAVTVESGVGRTSLPVCRRWRGPDGRFRNHPNPAGRVYDRLPVAVMRDEAGGIAACLFSCATHPTIVYGHAVSADYPGAAVRAVNAALGTQGAIFLQGCGGDSKPSVTAGPDGWISGRDELADAAGELLAREVAQVVEAGLAPVAPRLRCALTEVRWPLQPALPREGYVAQLTGESDESWRGDLHQRSLRRQIERLDRGETLTEAVPLLVQRIDLGEGLRLVALEGEPTAPFAYQIDESFASGVTFPLGYSNGTGMYLVDSQQLAEGGYEPESFWEYGWPAAPKAGFEGVLGEGLGEVAG